MNKLTLNPKLKDFWSVYSPIKCLYGGRDSSKTKDTAIWLLVQSMHYKLRIMCARQFQNRIEQSVYTELKWVIEQLGVQDLFTITNNKIICKRTGSEFFFYGIKRNLNDIKGTADIDILWIEEGEDLTQEQFDIIEPTIRKEGSFIIILFNPKLQTDFVWKQLVKGERKDVQNRLINYMDNPFLSNKSLERIRQLKQMDYDAYNHIYLGNPLADDDRAIIKRAYLQACIDPEFITHCVDGNYQLGYDVADDGGDTNAFALMNGYTLVYLEEFKAKEDELFDSSVKAFDLAFTYNAKLVYDGNGVGAGVGSNIKELIRQGYRKGTKIRYEAFDAGSKPANPKDMYLSEHGYTQMTNDEYFENRKAQAWWMLADKIRYTYSLVREYTKTGTIAGTINTEMLFTIDSKKLSPKILEKMIDELSTPRKEESGRLKNMVEKKKSLLDRGIKSPNLADAVVMANFRYNMDSKSTFGGKMRYT